MFLRFYMLLINLDVGKLAEEDEKHNLKRIEMNVKKENFNSMFKRIEMISYIYAYFFFSFRN